ncbi:TPA: NADP-dependent glyceraldehyde-3-phosphate dehydrogenase [Clostridium perfringens]|nr:NADP-dependent glyceraldehyde-3-phosphate dehydrogenase [Clostridium perfringens]EJT5928295.1 NADP-dependent glyceraldehyde-3-phosphate dehydrogenase [Clostridium perfringens]EJT6482964.1 NADP-dependent glyceraldehyde-3-phosphate dehydrogenase [Clostridium perfringens]BDA23494.1 NADP-dependent glyceraldehyde-3-phosphate dehydrogenase [Clostridium perfringens]HCG3024379.1 NADP-dependent glyceraldehyde-3-phosphate dehydrogenase [Clostridium perfringens]
MNSTLFKNIVNCDFYDSNSTELIEIRSPLDSSVLGKVQAMSQDDVDIVMSNSKEAQKSWMKTTISKRAEILYKTAELLLERKDEIAKVLVMEIAKDEKSAMSEVVRTADFLRFTADAAKSIEGESIPSDSFPGFDKRKISFVTREPLGVVLAISPFNYPVNLAASKIGPALMAGNSVVFKPATQGALSGLLLAKAFKDAGIPDGVLNTITGKGSVIGDYCVEHKDVDFINFTGSSEIGKRISKLSEMTPLLLELGGKDAAIVLGDADLDLTAKNIVAGAFSYSGQRCTAVKRVLVVEAIADKLNEKIVAEMAKLKVGNPLVIKDAQVVPLIDTKSADFVEKLMKDAENKGAKVLFGGNREGNLIEPTLYDNVTLDMDIAWDEPFGPILPIIRVKDKDEAIKIANESEYGLQSSVFTSNINDAFYIAKNLEVGTVQVNNKTERGPDHFPFLGIKSSGMGTQGIKYSIESMSRPKATVINLN